MSDLEALLLVQERDTVIDQLEHRLATLPQRAAVAAAEDELAAATEERAGVQGRRDELGRDQKRIEDEVATVEAKAAEVDATLYGGSVTSPKELQALQDDFAALKRRQTELEDRVIDVMEAIEPVDAQLAALDERVATATARRDEAATALTVAEAELAVELDAARTARAEAVATVPDALVATYEKLRPSLGGIAVARLAGSSCTGCHLTLAAAELDRVRQVPPDQPAYCEECGRILVR